MTHLEKLVTNLRDGMLVTHNFTTVYVSSTEPSKAARTLALFERNYRKGHGYLASIICIFGIIFNLCNVYVLTRRNMKSNSINALLTSIAAFDLLTAVSYLPFAIYFHILTDTSALYKHPVAWVYYAVISVDATVICHTAAMWLTVALATFRYIYVCRHTQAQGWCSERRAHWTIAIVTIVSMLLYVPTIICQKVVYIDVGNATHPWMSTNEFCNEDNFQSLNVLICGGLVKISACVVLLFFTSALLISLRKVRTKHTPHG